MLVSVYGLAALCYLAVAEKQGDIIIAGSRFYLGISLIASIRGFVMQARVERWDMCLVWALI
jgi:hypothetical protein